MTEANNDYWPIWIGSPDGDGVSIRELVPGSNEYAAVAVHGGDKLGHGAPA